MNTPLPISRFFDPTTATVSDASRELATLNKIGRKQAVFMSDTPKFDRRTSHRVGGWHIDRNSLVRKERFDASNWRHQIRISAHNDKSIASVVERIVKHLHSNVYIGAFLFHFLEVAIAAERTYWVATPNLLFLKATQHDCYQRKSGQRIQKAFLPFARIASHFGREVINSLYFVVWQESLKKSLQVEPLVSGVLQCTVIEIEPVDIDDAANSRLLVSHDCTQRNKTAGRIDRPNPPEGGGVVLVFYKYIGRIPSGRHDFFGCRIAICGLSTERGGPWTLVL